MSTDPADAMRAREKRARERLYPDEQAYRNDKARAAAMRSTQTDKATEADLFAFLRARLDEDEDIARAATPSPWRDRDETDLFDLEIDAIHINRQEPSRVLAEVEAKRRMVEQCAYMAGWNADHDHMVTEREITMMRTAASELLRLLALPYADHQEYREEWRP